MSSGSRRSEYFPIVGRLLSRIAFFSFQLFLFLVLVCSVWVTSALLYSILYNWTIPLAELRVPVFLDYRPNQLDAFAIANSSLVSRQWTPSRQLQELYHGFRADNLLNAKELYDVDLLLSIPESNVNSACGVVTIVAEICSSFKKLESRDFVKLAESTRSFVPSWPTKSTRFVRKMILILPYAFGIMQEVEAFEVRLFEEFMEHPKMRATNLVIRIHGDPLNVNQAALRFTVKLSGMRWVIYNWFFTSAVFGIFQISVVIWFSLAIFYVLLTYEPSKDKLLTSQAEDSNNVSTIEPAVLEDSEE